MKGMRVLLLVLVPLAVPLAQMRRQQVNGAARASIHGIVEDADGAVVAGAAVHLSGSGSTTERIVTTAPNDSFLFD